MESTLEVGRTDELKDRKLLCEMLLTIQKKMRLVICPLDLRIQKSLVSLMNAVSVRFVGTKLHTLTNTCKRMYVNETPCSKNYEN